MFNFANLEKCNIKIKESTKNQMQSTCVRQNYHRFFLYFLKFKCDLVEILYKKRRLCTKSNPAMDDLTVLLGTSTISE